MNRVRIMIADSDSNVQGELAVEIAKHENLELIAVANNGREAMELIESTEPDIIILELLLPVMDGFSVLEGFARLKAEKGIKSKIIVTSAISSDSVVKEVFRVGADIYIVKPYDVECIINRVISMSTTTQDNEIGDPIYDRNSVIEQCLLGVGVPAKLKGYRYIVSAVEEVIREPEMIYGITKILYPEIAKKHQSTSIRVEKAIRHAIEVAWARCDEDRVKKYLGDYQRSGKRPTNSEFIALVAQKIKPVA